MPRGGEGGVGGSRFVPTPQHLLPLGGSVGTHSRGGAESSRAPLPTAAPKPDLARGLPCRNRGRTRPTRPRPEPERPAVIGSPQLARAGPH